MPQSPDAAAARIAARQHGLITWRQATIVAGLTERQVAGRVAATRWRKLQRGVYVISGTAPSYLQSLLAAQLSARTEKVVHRRGRAKLDVLNDAVVTGRSAVWLRGCRRLGKPVQHELLVDRLRAPAVQGATIRRTRVLPPGDVERVDGVPTLAVPRLTVELCGVITDVDFVATLDDLLGRGAPELREEVHARAVQLRPGRKAVGRLVELTEPAAATAFRSWLERAAADLFTRSALPPAAWNVELLDAGGRLVGIGDAVWARERVVVELDGLRFHGSADQRRRDNRKDRRLGALGWIVLRYTWLDVTQCPDVVAAEVREVLARRSPVDRGVSAATHVPGG